VPIKRIRSAAVLMIVLLAAAVGCQRGEVRGTQGAPAGPPAFVGAARCGGCHPKEAEAYRGSDHARAMQPANEQTALGDFGGARFTHRTVTSTFFRRDGKFFVRTDGPDGKPGEFEIAYAFGVRPLQQYLVPFPDGRVQTLGVAWDARPRAQGGQRWFHLYPAETLRPPDPLHWTGREQTWNYQCAECHSTDLRKGYDGATNRYAMPTSVRCLGLAAPPAARRARSAGRAVWTRVKNAAASWLSCSVKNAGVTRERCVIGTCGPAAWTSVGCQQSWRSSRWRATEPPSWRTRDSLLHVVEPGERIAGAVIPIGGGVVE